MIETMEFPMGTEVLCRDGVCGQLTRVVVDPIARKVTHLGVEPSHVVGQARLVPLELVETSGDELRLTCALDDFEKLEAGDEIEFLTGVNSGLDYGGDQVWGLPYYGLRGLAMNPRGGAGAPEVVVYDRVPPGEIDIRRGETVHASDGTIGKVQGLVVDPRDHEITHVLLQEGHLWGKKEVAIPVKAVTDVKEGIHLSLTKDEVKALPEVSVDQPFTVDG